jgi:hydrogenase expression/formation protein HypD
MVAELKTAIDETAHLIGRPVAVMHVCGTHEHEISRYALRQLLPENVRLIAGPGCPVCITPASVIATAITLAEHPVHPILCTYGDMVRVPIRGGSLLDARSRGADIRVIYSIRDAAKLAIENPNRQVVFFSVGFETTAAPVAALLKSGMPSNFSIYCCHRYVPAALRILCQQDISAVDGFLLPGHASVITGIEPYRFLPDEFGRASAVAGFEPAEILSGMLAILRQIATGTPDVDNCYPRAVRDTGNPVARMLIGEVFSPCDAAWRGIGILPETGLELGDSFQFMNALTRFGIVEIPAEDIMPGCICHLVLLGKNESTDCPLFGRTCTPENPQGPCMVSAEGTCRARFLYPEGNYV